MIRLYDARIKPEDPEKAIRDIDEQLRRIRHAQVEAQPKEAAPPVQSIPQWFLDHLGLMEAEFKRLHIPENEWKYWGGF